MDDHSDERTARPPEFVGNFIIELTASNDAETNWQLLLRTLRSFGFVRVLYGKKIDPDPSKMHNLSNSILLSSYGEKLDASFLRSRQYLNSPTFLWAMRNYGAISWGVMAEQADKDRLAAEQQEVVRVTRQQGLTAGFTYSVPAYTETYRSAFGLAFAPGRDQSEADQVWADHGHLIEPILCAFDLAFAQFRNVPKGQELDTRTLRFMGLIAEGRSLREVAELEGCHYRTVDNCLAEARALLGANNTLHAVVLAKGQGQL